MNLQFLKRQKENGAGGFDQRTYRVPDDGKPHVIRVISANGVWSTDILQHWATNPLSKTGQQRPYLCLADQPVSMDLDENGNVKKIGKVCPFCEARQKYVDLSESGDHSGDELKAINYRKFKFGYMESALLYVVDREKESDGWKRFFAGKPVYNQIFNLYVNHMAKAAGYKSKEEMWERVNSGEASEELSDVFDNNNGFDLIITKIKGEDNRIVHTVSLAENPSPLGDSAQMAVWLGTIEKPEKFIADDIKDSIDTYELAAAQLEVEAGRKREKPLSKRQENDDDLPLPPRRQQPSQAQPQEHRGRVEEAEGPEGDSSFVDPDDAEFITPQRGSGGVDFNSARQRLKMLSAEEED